MAKRINEIKDKISKRLIESFYSECWSAYEERKAICFGSSRPSLGRQLWEYMEASNTVIQRPKWKIIYKLAEVFDL